MIRRPHILVISDLFPNRIWPADGIFIERQAHDLSNYCDSTIVAPVRVFPPLSIWKKIKHISSLQLALKKWKAEIDHIPKQDVIDGLQVYYPRYTSPPRQLVHASWGYFAYPFVRNLLKKLHSDKTFDLIHAHFATPAGTIALLASQWMRVPVILSVHGSEVAYTAHQNIIGRKIVKNVFENVSIILTNSTRTTSKVKQISRDSQVEIVRLGANPPPDLEATRKTNPDDGVVHLLSVGHLEDSKGQDYVLKAIRILIEEGYKIDYRIIGIGTKEEKLKALTVELGLTDIVSFEGYKDHSDVWQYFNQCDVFVLPSWNEAFGIVYIEALSVGKPVIGCQGQGGPEDLKALGDCIELVKGKDLESLVQGLRRIITDPARRMRMGNLGREIVKRHFTWEETAKQTFEIYKRYLPGNEIES